MPIAASDYWSISADDYWSIGANDYLAIAANDSAEHSGQNKAKKHVFWIGNEEDTAVLQSAKSANDYLLMVI